MAQFEVKCRDAIFFPTEDLVFLEGTLGNAQFIFLTQNLLVISQKNPSVMLGGDKEVIVVF